MVKQFKLDEKRFADDFKHVAYHEEDIKEFIKRELDLFIEYSKGKITYGEFIIKREKLVGDKLITK